MTDAEEREAALRQADLDNIRASEARQLGFREYARWLKANADAALKFAARPPARHNDRD